MYARFAPAIAILASLASPSAQAPDTRAAVTQAVEAGEEAIRKGDPKTALERFSRASRQIEGLDDPPLLARTLNGLGWAQWANGQYEPSLATRRRALDLYRQLGNAGGEAYVLRGIGETYFGLGRYDAALAEYQLALEAAARARNTREEGLILANMGSAYRSLGRLDDAMAALERSVAVLRPLNVAGDLSLPYTFLGIVTRARGEFERALGYYNDALTAVRAENNRRQESQILGNMGNVYLDLGRYDRAIELYRQSLAIAEQVNYAAQIGFAHQNIANVLNRVGRPGDAMPHFEAALKTWRALNRRAQLGYTLNNLGVLRLRDRRDAAGARVVLDEALAIGRDIKEAALEGNALMNLGDIEFNAGRYRDALAKYDEALASGENNPNLRYQLLDGRGAALQKLDRLDEAIAALRESAAIVNDMRADVASDQSKIAFLDTRQAVFVHLADALVEAGRVDEALEASEAVRARALADLMKEGRVPAAAAKLRDQSRELASLVAAETPRAAEARAVAGRLNGAAIVEYLITDNALLAFVVRSDAIRVRRLPTPIDTLDRRVRDLRQRLGEPQADPAGADRLTALLRDMHRDLIAPIAEWLPREPDVPVVIVPHGPLMLLSFAALVDSAGVPLVERHTLSYAPALSVFRHTEERRARAAGRGTALIVADPVPPPDAPVERLPASLQEARAVQQRLGAGNAAVLSGAAASEAAVKRAAGSKRILHLATHGLVSEQRPLASALLLAAGEGDDGYLRADEVFGMTLDADLVVLSGCSTGLGRLSGEGLLGLTRSFFFAGTASVLVSQWDISDVATVGLMDRFYAELARGTNKAAALREAQLETRNRYPHPAYWAAFALQGELH